MVYTENTRKSIQKWRDNNREKFNEYNTDYMKKYREPRRDEYNQYMKILQRKLKDRREYNDYELWAKSLRKMKL
jgi:hypothetical protein